VGADPNPACAECNAVRQIENTPTASGDTPLSACVITASGQLAADDPSLNVQASTSEGDVYEDFPDDEESIDVGNPVNALQVHPIQY
jgi:peptidyl-prolyl isomerase D